MKISCSDCRRQLGEMFNNSDENGAVPPALQEHLAQCAECRSELALMTAAREEMRSFPVVSAPVDLRSRIRVELEANPKNGAAGKVLPAAATAVTAAASASAVEEDLAEESVAGQTAPEETHATVAASNAEEMAARNALDTRPAGEFPRVARTFPAPSAFGEEEAVSPVRQWNDNFRAFLRHPTNITWISCATILLFYFVSLSRPRTGSSPLEDLPDQKIVGSYKQRDADEKLREREVFTAPRHTLPDLAARPGDKKPAAPLSVPALSPKYMPPGQPLPFGGAPLADPKPYPQKPSADILDSGFESAFESDSKIEPSPTPTGMPLPAPKPQVSTPTFAKRIEQATGKAEKPRAEKTGVQKPDAETFASAPRGAQNETTRFATRSTPEALSGASGATAATGPVGPAGPPAAFTAPMTRATAPDSARENRERRSFANADSNTTADRAAAGNITGGSTTRRKIAARITPPRTIGWAQVSVNLPEGARFSDGSRARVVWRGGAQSNEPIDIEFDIIAGSGSQEVKLTLQEVRGSEAQTVAYKTVTLGERR